MQIFYGIENEFRKTHINVIVFSYRHEELPNEYEAIQYADFIAREQMYSIILKDNKLSSIDENNKKCLCEILFNKSKSVNGEKFYQIVDDTSRRIKYIVFRYTFDKIEFIEGLKSNQIIDIPWKKEPNITIFNSP